MSDTNPLPEHDDTIVGRLSNAEQHYVRLSWLKTNVDFETFRNNVYEEFHYNTDLDTTPITEAEDYENLFAVLYNDPYRPQLSGDFYIDTDGITELASRLQICPPPDSNTLDGTSLIRDGGRRRRRRKSRRRRHRRHPRQRKRRSRRRRL